MASHQEDEFAEKRFELSIDQAFQNATKSIQYAETVMTKTQTSVEKVKSSKDNRNKVISKASEVVNALLEPASQVANLLDGLGGIFPPCKAASNILAAIVKLEVERRDNDVRVGTIYLEMSSTLITLGTLKPGFQTVRTLVGPLGQLIDRICDTMKDFGRFSEAFYEAKSMKSKLKHLIHSKGNKDMLAEYREKIIAHKAELNLLLSHQAVLVSASNAKSLSRIDAKIDKLCAFYNQLSDEKEESAAKFIVQNGGVEMVQNNDALLDALASKLGETLSPSIRRAVKESADENFRQSQASFMLKFQFALEQRIDESQEMILNELKSGPYELIRDPDVKEIWKNTAAKESSVKRRQFIDALNYHFNIQFKKYKAEHNRAERDDAWTRAIFSKVHYHPAIGDAIDDDASGFISVDELNEFLRKKPESWTIPQWIAYWAHGWDADNIVYQGQINKAFKQLKKLQEQKGPNAVHIGRYLEATEERIAKIANSVYIMQDLEPSAVTKMDKLRDEWRTLVEDSIKKRLKTVNFKIDFSSVNAVAGSERVEATFLPLTSLLITRHVTLLGKPSVGEADVDEAIASILVLTEVIHSRIAELKAIWRRQRIDVDTQIRYYANGLLQDYYRAYRKTEFDTDVEDDDDDESDWNSEDEWASDDAQQAAPSGEAAVPASVGGQYQQTTRDMSAPSVTPAASYSAPAPHQLATDPNQRYRRDTPGQQQSPQQQQHWQQQQQQQQQQYAPPTVGVDVERSSDDGRDNDESNSYDGEPQRSDYAAEEGQQSENEGEQQPPPSEGDENDNGDPGAAEDDNDGGADQAGTDEEGQEYNTRYEEPEDEEE